MSSGDYLLPSTTVTGQFFDQGASFATVEGSNITYKPPTGTKQVIYKFCCHIAGREYNNYSYSNSFIASFQGYLDSTALNFKFVESHHGGNDTITSMQMIFEIGDTDDVANGKLTSWTDQNYFFKSRSLELSPKVFYFTCCWYFWFY